MDVRLREYRRDDLDAMVVLDAVCFAPEFLFHRRSMQEFAEARNAVTVLAEGEGLLAGFCIVHLERVARAVRGYVVTLDVAPGLRRRGLAGRLMDSVEMQAGAAGAGRMELHVYVENAAAVRFYAGRGYQRLGLEAEFYGAAGRDAYVYRKELQV